jgi:hypothetical protein
MAICPDGHATERSDYCDVCGKPLSATRPDGIPPPERTTSGDHCPQCNTERQGRFCERCRHDFGAGASARPVRAGPASARRSLVWVAVVRADPAHYQSMTPPSARIPFPTSYPERRITLVGATVTIGRRRDADTVAPDIDLSHPPEDPAISHRHAELRARPDSTWDVVDCGSRNGTYIDRATSPIPPHRPIRVTGGSLIRIGAWTAITLRATSA